MSQNSRKIRFGLWYDFRNPSQWRQAPDRLYSETLDQIAWGENHGFDDVWLSEHHFIDWSPLSEHLGDRKQLRKSKLLQVVEPEESIKMIRDFCQER